MKPERASAAYGPNPWQQTQWDWRAAANFIAGGAGSGLIVWAALALGAGTAQSALLIAGLALVGAGLFCVWLEIGRPLRALHVFFNPRTSWMSREAFVAALLFPVTAVTVFVLPALAPLAALLALAFMFCQSSMLRAARGIPAWREPWLRPLILASALVEGAGLALLLAPASPLDAPLLRPGFAALLVLRALAWFAYRRRLAGSAAPRALAAIDKAGAWLLLAGTLAPLALLAEGGAWALPVGALAGALAAAAGAGFKHSLVTRAGFNQGFKLVHLPVRGVRRR